jgi:hypothetical protein
MSVSRRQFLASTATAASGLAAPAIAKAGRGVQQDDLIIGQGDYRYRVSHNYPQLPDKYTWQTTHNVAVDSQNNLYVIHEGKQNLKDHPSIFVFGPDGKFIRAFGKQFQGGGHGIEVRKENGQEVLYVCAYQQVKSFAKMTLKGETIWQKYAPMDSGVYADNEDTKPEKKWGRNRFMPTNFAFLPNGDFYLADGYGSFCIHLYDNDGNWKSHFGGPGKGEGKFNTPHGIWIDSREGRESRIVVCDRANHTLQYLTLDGKYVETVRGYGLPANCDTYKNLLLVPELHARVTLLDETNKVVAQLGADVNRIKTQGKKRIREDEKLWNDGRFVHPHDACFDLEGNIHVAEWVHSGRVTKLTKVA